MKKIYIGEKIIVKDLAKKIGIREEDILMKCISLGIKINLNEEIDFSNALKVSKSFDITVEKKSHKTMNDMDLYIGTIDEKEADKILKFMGQNVKKSNLKFKKIMVKKVLKNPGINGKRNKTNNKESPFNFVLERHILKKDENMSEKRFFIKTIHEENMTDYEKMANIICWCPNILEEYRDEMAINIEKNRNIFELNVEFENDDEVAEYIENASIWIDGSISNMIHYLFELFEFSKDIEKNADDFEKIKNMTLKDFQNSLLQKDWEIEKYLAKYIFAYTHKEKKDILHILIIESIIDFVEFKKNEINKLENELNRYNKKSENNKKFLQKYEDDKMKLLNKIEKLKKDKEKLLLQQKEDINKHKEEQKVEKNNFKNQVVELERELESNKKTIYRFKDYMKTIFNNEENKLFGIVITMDIKITKNIYPEIEFVEYSKFKRDKDRLKAINKIYIQREGLSSHGLEKIERFAHENNIETNIEFFRNEKELIEKIALLKMEETKNDKLYNGRQKSNRTV